MADIAVIAVIASSGMGLAGVVVPAVTAGRHQQREHEAKRQREARQERRQLLDDGAVLIRRMMRALDGMKTHPEDPERLTPQSAAPLEALVPEIAAQNARMQVWFSAESEVYKAWQIARTTAAAHAVTKGKIVNKDTGIGALNPALQAYADAAREYLTGEQPWRRESVRGRLRAPAIRAMRGRER